MKAYIQTLELTLAETTTYSDATQTFVYGDTSQAYGIIVAPGMKLSMEASLTHDEVEELLALVQRIEERLTREVLPQASYKAPA